MILFGKEKELIFKITNAILLLWLVGAIIFTLVSVVNYTLKEPELTYEEYEVINCKWYLEQEDADEIDAEKRCQDDYKASLVWRKNDRHNQKIVIYGGIINVVVVGGVLFLMNKEKVSKK